MTIFVTPKFVTLSNMIILVHFLLLTLLAPFAYADETNTSDKKFQDYILNNKKYNQVLELKNNAVFKLTSQDCAEEITADRLKPISIIPIEFQTIDKNSQDNNSEEEITLNKNPSFGQWIERSVLKACNQSIQINQIVSAYHGSYPPKIYPLLNGETYIDSTLQERAETSVSEALQKQPYSCYGDIFVKDTKFLGYRALNQNRLSKTNQNSGWFEQWLIEACRKERIVNIAILPDPKTFYRYLTKVKE